MKLLALSALLPALLLGACGTKTLDPVFVPVTGGTDAAPADAGTGSPASLESGLVAHWTFDETDGNTVHDVAGIPAHDGTKNGGTWQADGRFKGALSLMRGQHVEIGNFPQAMSSFAISLWVRFKASDIGTMRATVISNQISSGNGQPQPGGWEVLAPGSANTTKLEFAYPLVDTPQSSSNWVNVPCCAAVFDSWIHVTAMLDGAKQLVTVYAGETQQNMKPSVTMIRSGSPQLFIGAELAERSNSNFQGTIDDIRIYNRILTVDEIRQLNQVQ